MVLYAFGDTMRTIVLSLFLAASSYGQNSVTAGRLHVDPPTLENLGFLWSINGDANRNGQVSVEYRQTVETAWRQALPLLRIGGEQIGRDRENLKYIVPDGFAGSILNLTPGTEYDIRLTLSDPDGASGETTRTPEAAHTRRTASLFRRAYAACLFARAQRPAAGTGIHWHSGSLLRRRAGRLERRLGAEGQTGRYVAGSRRALPPGTPQLRRSAGGALRGDIRSDPEGHVDKPITIKAAGDGEVVFDGAGNHVLFDVMGTSHHIFDGITFRNTDVAMLAGKKELAGATNLTVRNCRFENVGFGIWTEYAGSREFYIADNLFLGRDDRYRLVGWTGPRWGDIGPYSSHLLTSYYAVKVYGPGHIIAHNAIAYFHDGIGISTYGTPEADLDRQAAAIDIYNNDLHMLNDDFVETDGGVRNIRVYRNRGVNAFHGGYSSQPVFGGPVYFFRNLLYHVQSGVAFKLDARPAGLLDVSQHADWRAGSAQSERQCALAE